VIRRALTSAGALIAAVGLLLTVGGCSSSAATTTLATATRAQASVTVRASLIDRGSDGWQLTVQFVPPSPGFHLYSLSLPNGGVQGLGIPTRLSVRGALTAAGAVTADQPTQQLDMPALGVKLPVYPDGPVTLTLPVRRTDGPTAQIVVSYGACSSATCLAPVIDEAIPLAVP
jgi:cytochrome c biogenesis DsbD-like protein